MSDYEEDFELENLRQAALKSMQSKASANSVIGNNGSGSHTSRSNSGKPSQSYAKKNFESPQRQQQQQQFHPQSGGQFHAQFDGNQPHQFNSNQQFNQYNHPSHYDQPPFSGGGGPPPFANGPPFGNNVPLQHFNHQFSNQPPQFRNHPNHQFNGPPYPAQSQFNQPPPFTQPQKSNLIVISAGKSSNHNEMMNEHPMMPNSCYPGNSMNAPMNAPMNGPMNPAMMPHPGHHLAKHSRNGFGRQGNNKKFGNRRGPGKARGQSNNVPSDGRPKDVPTDSSKSTDNLPSRFRRIDRDSSSEEDDEESDNDDNIERFRQTYDTNESSNQEDRSSTSKSS